MYLNVLVAIFLSTTFIIKMLKMQCMETMNVREKKKKIKPKTSLENKNWIPKLASRVPSGHIPLAY